MIKSRLNKTILSFAVLFGFALVKPVFANSQDLFSQPFLTQIHQTNPSGSGQVIIAVIDEGIDFKHSDLAATKHSEKSFLNEKSQNFLRGSHGTQVAGIIIATTQGSSQVKLMNLVACGQNDGCDMEAIIKAIYYATDNGASIINLSFEVTGPDSYRDDFNDAIIYAYKHNVIVVASAGNGDENHIAINLDKQPVSPVCNDNGENMVLGVSSIDENGQLPAWANYGSCVDVYAPGANLYTTLAEKFSGNNSYAYKSGTSYSAGIVSAEAALAKIQYPQASARQIADLIKNSSRKSEVINIAEALSENFQIATAFQSLPVKKAVIQTTHLPAKKATIKKASAIQTIKISLKPRG